MKQDVRNEFIKVEKWIEENNKVYLLSKTGKRYRYVGCYNFKQISDRFPKGTFINVQSTSKGILSDDQISWLR